MSVDGPHNTRLFQSMPNPSNGTVTIRVSLARSARRDGAIVRVYEASGRRVRELAVPVGGGSQAEVVWDGRDSFGRRAPSGVYFYQLVTDGLAGRGRKLLLVR